MSILNPHKQLNYKHKHHASEKSLSMSISTDSFARKALAPYFCIIHFKQSIMVKNKLWCIGLALTFILPGFAKKWELHTRAKHPIQHFKKIKLQNIVIQQIMP